MEAVAALSLGCNILQLIGTAVETGQFICEVYKHGKTDGKDRVSERLAQLESLSRVSKKLAEHPSLHSSQSEGRKNLLRVVLIYAKDAETLRKELMGLDVSGGRYHRLKLGVKAAIQNVPNKIEQVRDRLDENRRWLDSSVIQVLASDVQQLIHRQQIAFEKLDEASKVVLRKMDEGFGRLEAAQQRGEANIISHMEQQFLLQTVEQEQSDSRARSAQTLEDKRKKLLESLTYKGMGERVRTIPDASRNTFDWILDPDRDDLEHNFAKWLLDDRPLYWIQGLAGSGKSTLMKRIWTDKQTQRLVATKSAKLPSPIVKHSFWLPSPDPLRKSYRGMLHSTIHGLLSDSPSAIDSLLDKGINFRSFEAWNDWSEGDLETTLYDLLANRKLYGHTCIFLDALDEIESPVDQRKVLHCIRKLSTFEQFRTKICVSSRPESRWTAAFQQIPQMRVQDLTKGDIRAYAVEVLSDELPSEETASRYCSYETFLDEFVKKSQGVFIWAHLATIALLRMPVHSTWTEVHNRLRQMPQGMEDLYEQILAKRAKDTDSEKAEAATYLSLCLEPSYGSSFASPPFRQEEGFLLHQALPIWKAHFRKDTNYQRRYDLATFYKDYQQLEERILDICAGLLTPKYGSSIQTYPIQTHRSGGRSVYHSDWETTRPQYSIDDPSMVVFTFAHQTAADFLTDTPGGRQFIQRCPLSPQDFLTTHVDAEMLRWRLWHEHAPIYRTLGIETLVRLLNGIRKFSERRSGEISDLHMCLSIQRIKDVFAELHISGVDRMQVEASHAASAYVFTLAKTQAVMKHGETWIAFDIEELLLEAGINVWYKSCEGDLVKPDASRVDILTTAYKNYLLICAAKGNLPVVARHLVHYGADLYAEHYLPVSRPELRSAAGQLLVRFVTRNRRDLTRAHVATWGDVVSSCKPKSQYLTFQPSWGWSGFNGSGFGGSKPRRSGSTLRLGDFLQTTDISYDATFILDVSAHLNLWLRHATREQEKFCVVDPEDFVGYWISTKPDPFEMSILPLRARSWQGFVYGWGVETHLFPNALPFRCCECLADENDGFWKLFPESKNRRTWHKHCHLDRYGLFSLLPSIGRSPLDEEESEKAFYRSLGRGLRIDGELIYPPDPEPEELEPKQPDPWRERQAEMYEEYLLKHGFLLDPLDIKILQEEPMRIWDELKANAASSRRASTGSTISID